MRGNFRSANIFWAEAISESRSTYAVYYDTYVVFSRLQHMETRTDDMTTTDVRKKNAPKRHTDKK